MAACGGGSAQTTCFKLLPGNGSLRQKASAAQVKAADETAQCMREHRVTDYPDPIIVMQLPANFNQANYSSIEGGNGIIIAIPKSINEQSPALIAAAKACEFGAVPQALPVAS